MNGHQADLSRKLENLGLAPAESAIYLMLLQAGRSGAAALSAATGINRSSTYAALRSLAEQGLVEGGSGYGSHFRAVPPARALPDFVEHERERLREELDEREREAKELVDELAELVDVTGNAPLPPPEVAEVIRSDRTVADRFARLQLEAQHTIDMFVVGPLVSRRGNPEELNVLERGVRVRALYESALVSDPSVKPYLNEWIDAGEEARFLPGKLPFKLALFDGSSALMPLEDHTIGGGYTGILIRSRSFASGLGLLFESLWEKATSLQSSAG